LQSCNPRIHSHLCRNVKKALLFSLPFIHKIPSQAGVNFRLQNQLNMIGACITIAQSSDYKSTWDGKEPADFGTDLALVTTAYGTISAKHAEAKAATGGGADAKALAEASLESGAYVLARALAVHFKKIGDLDRRGKINFTKSDIVRLRDRDLIAQATAIRDIAAVAVSEPGAAGRGVSAARVATFSAAIEKFTSLLTIPRGQIVNRSTLLKEVQTDTAALLDQVEDLDDLVLQFDDTPAGQRFLQAWKKARIIVDAGHGHGDDDDEEESDPTPPPAT
jgi:hypothetical protein